MWWCGWCGDGSGDDVGGMVMMVVWVMCCSAMEGVLTVRFSVSILDIFSQQNLC